MRQVASHTFRGQRWRIVNRSPRKSAGLCSPPGQSGKAIWMAPKLCEPEALEVAIHEAMHACLWDTAEEAITESASDIAAFLWRLGWRRGEN